MEANFVRDGVFMRTKNWKRWEAALLLALVVTLASNWWSVVYPSLCADMPQTVAAQGAADAEAQPYELKFRSLELWQQLMRFLGK